MAALRFGLQERKSNMISNANHYTLAVSDLEKSFTFYKDVLGLKPLCKWEEGAYFLVGDFWFCLNLDKNRKPIPDPHYTHFAFSVAQEHLPVMVEHLKNYGVEAFLGTTEASDSFYFLDPDGYRLELHIGTWQERLQKFKTRNDQGVEYFV